MTKTATLIIDSNERDCFWLGLAQSGKNPIIKRFERRAQDIQVAITKILLEEKMELGQLKNIAFVRRDGSLTGSRIGAVTVNTLGWLEKIPVIDLSADSIDDACDQLERGPNNTVGRLGNID
jgi:tRNA A37 threonylcarbamoyladenosine modification protein TsaB